MNIEDVRAFVAAVDSGSVAKAAVRLNLTQPAISRRIQRLEEDLGVALLDRDSKPAKTTRAGEAAYRRCVAVLRATEALRLETHGAANLGPLRLGFTYALSDSMLTPAVEAVRKNCPDVQLRVVTDRSPLLRKQVEDGLLDAAIVASLPSRPLDSPHATSLGTEKVAVVGPANLGREVSHIRDLADLPWVINPDGCGFRSQLDQALAASGHTLNVIAEIWGTAPQLALIARGAGLGLVPERLVEESPHRASLRVMPIEDFQASVSVWLVRSGQAGVFEHSLEVLQQAVAQTLASDARSTWPGTRNRGAKML
jgi:DNA-binding transcriptional LysR family regulator